MNIHWSLMESNNNEPLTFGDDPESITANPPKRNSGLSALTVIKLVPIFN